MTTRRSILRTSLLGGSMAGLGGLDFLTRLQPVTAQDAQPLPGGVKLHDEIEPLVRLLEDTPRDRVLEEVGARLKSGLSYRELLAALLLAGVRNIQPRPVGFKFHAVLVVNSAHLASLASADSDRWLPLFWAIDQFKSSQEADRLEGDWTMGPVDEKAVPPPEKARAALIQALDRWDEAAADAAIVGLVRSTGADELFDLLCRYGARDYRDIGHKEIYVANSFRTLEAIGWHHAEPVLRSLVYALLDRSGARENPAEADLPADRPFRANLQRLSAIRPGWTVGTRNAEATTALLDALRTGSPDDASALVVDLLARGAAPASLFDACLAASGELMMRDPGIVSLHASTFTNAAHYSWNRCGDDATRRLLLLQNAAFLPLFRGAPKTAGTPIDQLEPLPPTASGPDALAEIFTDISADRATAARKTLAWLRSPANLRDFAAEARRLVFLKGTNSHDYKFSSAVLEDFATMAPGWRERFLASSVFYLRGSEAADNGLAPRIREALKG
ncbi:MAG: hypothetical protein ACKV19_13810 [Verrucomicrobiales bacterium]